MHRDIDPELLPSCDVDDGGGDSGSSSSTSGEECIQGLDVEGFTVFGLDPGRKTLFYASASSNKYSEQVWCSNKGYRHHLRVQPRQRKTEKWLTKKGLKEFIDKMPTAKVITAALLEAHIRYCFTRLEDVLKLYGSKRYRKFKQNGFYTKQRVLNKLVARITKGRRKVLLAYGSANVGSCVRGNPPIAAKAFRRHCKQRCKVVMIDEFRTSRVCSACEGDLVQMTGKVQDKKTKEWKRNRPIWAVQVCQDCGTVWNRDRNASINILRIFNTLQSRGERPLPFCRDRSANH